jgi:hypothetical protein
MKKKLSSRARVLSLDPMEFKNKITPIALLILSAILCPAVSLAQDKGKETPRERTPEEIQRMVASTKTNPPSGAGFYIAPIEQSPGRYSFTLSDGEGRFVSDSMTETETIILEAVLLEARRFAQTDQNAGVKKPIITRFFDKQANAFFVDVMKMGVESRFFITIKGLTSRITVDAGAIKRGDKQANPLFYEIINRVQTVRAAAQ